MTDVTRILSQIESGVPAAADQLLPLVYEELRNWPPPNWLMKSLARRCRPPRWYMRPTYG